MKNFERLLSEGRLSFYGYSYSELPKEIIDSDTRKAEIFFKRKGQRIYLKKEILWNYYSGFKDTSWSAQDIIFFDQDSVKSLCIGFPSKSKYIAISLKYPRYYFFIILGLIRRILLRSISIKGIIKLNNTSKYNRWLLIKPNELSTNSLNISNKIGISGLLEFLKEKKVRYLVPRFYEELPNLEKSQGDLDLIVDGEDKNIVIDFLMNNPGDIPIDVYTDNGTDFHGMSYLPPKMAKTSLMRRIPGPGGSFIPTKKDELDSIIYHALYHKGYLSRIKSETSINQKNDEDNKYTLAINRLSRDLGLNVGDTLEELDHYMATEGWRPAIDTLAKIAQWNEWVRDYHMKINFEYVPLYILILKEGLRGSKKEELLLEKCFEEGLKLIDEEELHPDIKKIAITELRGGIWNDSLDDPKDVINFYPYKMMIFWDTYGRKHEGIAKVKEKIRQLVDTQKTSLVHSTDSYIESLDYIKVCMPDRFSFYEDPQLLYKNFSKFSIKNKNFKQRINDVISFSKKQFKNLMLYFFSH